MNVLREYDLVLTTSSAVYAWSLVYLQNVVGQTSELALVDFSGRCERYATWSHAARLIRICLRWIRAALCAALYPAQRPSTV